MSGPADNLDGRQELAIAALLSETTQDAAAAKVGISVSTLRRWMQQPEFIAAYRAARRCIVEGVIASIQKSADEAVTTLRRAMTCGTPAVEVRAAQVVLDNAIKGVEVGDVIERLEELEAVLGELRDAKDSGPAGRTPRAGEGPDDFPREAWTPTDRPDV